MKLHKLTVIISAEKKTDLQRFSNVTVALCQLLSICYVEEKERKTEGKSQSTGPHLKLSFQE